MWRLGRKIEAGYLSKHGLAEQIDITLRRLAKDFRQEDMRFQRMLKKHTMTVIIWACIGGEVKKGSKALYALFGLGSRDNVIRQTSGSFISHVYGYWGSLPKTRTMYNESWLLAKEIWETISAGANTRDCY